MSIKDDLDKATCGDALRVTALSALTSFELLGSLLGSLKDPFEVLQVLRVELETRARESYIQRIYGRYRKLLPTKDLEEIKQWAKLRAASKNISTNMSETSEVSLGNIPVQDEEESQTE